MAGYLLCICFTHTLLVSIMAVVCPAGEILIAPGFIEYQIEFWYCISHLLDNMCTTWNIFHTHTDRHTHTYTHTHTHTHIHLSNIDPLICCENAPEFMEYQVEFCYCISH